MSIATVTGSIVINRSAKYMETEIREKILITAEKYAAGFSSQFNHMEGLTDSLASYCATRFDMEMYQADPEGYVDGFEEELASVIVQDLKNVRNAHSLYVTFNPELSTIPTCLTDNLLLLLSLRKTYVKFVATVEE